MDQIMIKMAFTEILNMPELPVKVSLNEYIEISKYYSTNKSKMFINGLIVFIKLTLECVYLYCVFGIAAIHLISSENKK